MAEIRKVLEHRAASALPQLGMLRLFCNWALHIEIDKTPKNVRQYFAGYDLQPDMTEQQFIDSQFFKEVLNLKAMREALREFIQMYGLSDLILKREEWSHFVGLYTRVVAEVPIKYCKDDLRPDEIAEIIVWIRSDNDLQPSALWTVRLKDGQTFSSEIVYRTHSSEA